MRPPSQAPAVAPTSARGVWGWGKMKRPLLTTGLAIAILAAIAVGLLLNARQTQAVPFALDPADAKSSRVSLVSGPVWSVRCAGPVHTITYSPDGSVIAVGVGDPDAYSDADARVTPVLGLLSAQSGRVMRRSSPVGPLSCLVFLAGNSDLVSIGKDASSGQDTLQTWDRRSGSVLRTQRLGEETGSLEILCISPDGRLVIAGNNDTLGVWDAAHRTPLKRLVYPVGSASPFAVFSSDGRHLAACSCGSPCSGGGGAWALYDATSWQLVKSVKVSPDAPAVLSAAFSRDGKTLALLYLDRIELRGATNGDVLDVRRFDSHEWGSVLFSPSGALALSDGKEVSLCDQKGMLVRWQAGDDDEGVAVMAFSPDGKYLVTGGATHVRLWRIDAAASK